RELEGASRRPASVQTAGHPGECGPVHTSPCKGSGHHLEQRLRICALPGEIISRNQPHRQVSKDHTWQANKAVYPDTGCTKERLSTNSVSVHGLVCMPCMIFAHLSLGWMPRYDLRRQGKDA
ncbi:hypothetical protein BGV07_18965, partial [Clostridioides difficile]